jgi:c(7)-type cytochrome triheme protein
MLHTKKRWVAWILLLGTVGLGLSLYAYHTLEAQTAEPAPSQAPPSEPAPGPAEQTGEEQHPVAFDYLPKTKMGYVDWVQALKQGIIKPKDSLDPNAVTMQAIDFNVHFNVKADLPDVVFPHLPHTMWLDCRNCHPSIFLMKAGSNPITMEKILRGEFCGRCHGTVAFPISDCFRCHSKPK